jgi:tRNA G18 (ribose-2'-O)-methylase SpoU
MVGSEEALSAAAGFAISRGCLACGVVPAGRDEDWLLQYLRNLLQSESTSSSLKSLSASASKVDDPTSSTRHLRILALDGISDTANLGSMIRTASAFGVHAVLLSEGCCDAWYRRAVRVSMGHVFRVPTIRVPDLSHTLRKLAEGPYHVTSYAAVIDVSASLLNDLKPGKLCNCTRMEL